MFVVAEFWLVTPVVTVRVTPELTVKVAVVALLLLNVIELTVAPAVTVTEAPARTIALSVLLGTMPPVHVVVEFQFPPEVVVMRVALSPVQGPTKSTTSAANRRTNLHTDPVNDSVRGCSMLLHMNRFNRTACGTHFRNG